MHALLVEDDIILAESIGQLLNAHGISVEIVHLGRAAEHLIEQNRDAVVILDIGLPDIDGFEVIQRMRSRGIAAPVLVLTARDTVRDRVYGLEKGADDYLIKPFASEELVARVKALHRRMTSNRSELIIGDLHLDMVSKRAQIANADLELSVREWGVLEFLMRHVDKVVSKQQIIDSIAPLGEEMSTNAVEVYVSRIRLKIAAANVRLRTIRGFGYMIEKEPK
jgi:DNA-binding response OmpR family regulator